MNRIVTFLTMCVVAIATMAQNKAEIIVSYDYIKPTTNGKTSNTKMTLLAAPTEAKYFNDMSLWVDSLKSTPEGNAQYMEIFQKSCMTVEPDGSVSFDLTKGPVKSVSTYVFTNPTDGTLTAYDKFGDDLGYYTEPLTEQQWTVVEDSTATLSVTNVLWPRATITAGIGGRGSLRRFQCLTARVNFMASPDLFSKPRQTADSRSPLRALKIPIGLSRRYTSKTTTQKSTVRMP